MSTATEDEGGFLTFYREYAHTGIHTITATALTAFGLLTFVHWGFVVLAIAVYILPPVYLYLTRNGEAPDPVGEDTEAAGSERAAATESVDPDDGAATRDRGSSRPGETTDAGASESIDADVAGVSGDDGETPKATTAAGSATAGTGTGSADEEESEGSPETAPDPSGEDAGDEPTPAGDSSAARRTKSETGSEIRAGSNSTDSNASGGINAGDTDDEPADEDRTAEGGPAEWSGADSPTEEGLLDTVTVGSRAYATGEGGVLLSRAPSEEWELALEGGPAAESTTLRGVDATAEGDAVWVAGDGGVLGRYDSTTTRHTDHSAPEGITDNWADLAVAGSSGEERLALVNGSGQVLFGEYDGETVAWDEPVKPGSGSSMSAIAFVDDSTGYCCDTNAGVYRIDGSEFERVGIENASGFGALAATEETVVVTGDDGTVQRFDGSVWTPVRVAEHPISGLAVRDDEWLAAGAGGALYENRGGDWEAVDSSTEADLFAVASGDLPVAVGEGGTLLERA